MRRVAKDRVISVVDPEARHGHETSPHAFDGYKGHVAINLDSEIITQTVVTAGNAGDAGNAEELIEDLLKTAPSVADKHENEDDPSTREQGPAIAYGDVVYGTGAIQSRLHNADADSKCKTQPPSTNSGLFAKERCTINLDHDTVVCPAKINVKIR